MLAVVIPMLVAGDAAPEDLDTALGAVLTITVFSAAGLAWAYTRGEANLMWLSFWMYCYVFLGLAALTQISRDQWPLPVAPYHGAVTTASFLGLIGCFAWFIGYGFVRRRRGRPPATSSISNVRFQVFVWGAIAMAATYTVTVGIGQLFTSRQHFGYYTIAVFGSQANATLAIAIGVVPVAIAFLVQLGRRRRGTGVGLWLTLILLLVLNLIVSNVFTSSRTWVGTIVMAALLMVGRTPASARKMRALLIGWFVAFLVIFPQAAIFRNDQRGNIVRPNPADALVTGDYDSFQQMVHAVVYVAESGMQWGNQLLGSFFFFVPRSIWPNKAEGTGVILGQAMDLHFTNLSAPLWIEGYADFGVVGTIAFMAAWGVACAALDRRFIAELRRGDGAFMITVPLLAFWQTVILRGSLIAILPFVFAILGCGLFLGWKGKVPQSEREPAETLLDEVRPATSTASFL